MATTTVDIPATTVRMIKAATGPSADYFTMDLGNIASPGDITMNGGTITPGTNFFITQWGSGPVDGSFTLPTPPPGYPTLTAAYYTTIAYRLSSEAASFSAPGFGTMPNPVDSPFLQANSGSNPMVVDGIPIDSFGLAVGRASESLSALAAGSFADQWSVGAWNGSGPYAAHLHIGYFGLRLVYTGAGPTFAPPLRLTNRDDVFGSARRLTGSTSRQGSNRVTGYL